MKYWIETFTGKQFSYDDIRSSEIVIRDIAHSLSLQCRFNGHCSRFYSVGEHSILVAKAIISAGYNHDMALKGLLHDATEAYIPDIPKPLKHYWQDNYFKVMEYEDEIMAHIYRSLNITIPTTSEWAIIKSYDFAMLKVERDTLFKDRHLWEFPTDLPIVKCIVAGVDPEVAERHFLNEYKLLKV